MLNREAQEIQPANFKFDVSWDFKELQKSVLTCGYLTSQYYINNTVLDLTVMDTFGVRQTLPRRKDRSGDRVLKIIREYRFVSTLEQHTREFFDEVSKGDGPILMALKELVERDKLFCKKGFTTEFQSGVQFGHFFMVIFEISEDQISEHKTVDSTALGLTVSRLRREVMPANPVYSAVNSGNYYNPFKAFLNPKYTLIRIFANYIDRIKERFWYNLGDVPVEVEYTRKPELEEGIHIQYYVKESDSETAVNTTIKIVKFDEASNKNGFFTSERDAMLGSNVARSEREREFELKERAKIRETEAMAAEERLTQAKRELAVVKQQTDELNHQRQTKLQEIQHENAIGIEKERRRGLDAEHRLADQKAGLARLQMNRDLMDFHHDTEVLELKHSTEVLKIQGAALKHSQDMELASSKHAMTMHEMERSIGLAEAVFVQKMATAELDVIKSTLEVAQLASTNKRKAIEDSTKMVTTVANTMSVIGKLIF